MTSGNDTGTIWTRLIHARAIEQRTIEPIPVGERHGRPIWLFTLWFALNLIPVTIIVGIIPLAIGLSLPWAIATIVVGNLIGGIFMAYHSAQGPKLGVAQMIQSRAQFGVVGAALPLVIVVLMYIGYLVVGVVPAGEALGYLLHVSTDVGIVIFSVLGLIVAMLGYDLIHRYERYLLILLIPIFLALTVKLLTTSSSAHTPATHVTFALVLLAVSVVVTYQITYAPYVSDYSRYLPVDTKVSITFWYTYAGTCIATIWLMIVGTLAAHLVGSVASSDTIGYLSHLLGSTWIWLVLVAIVLGQVGATMTNLYGPFLTSLGLVATNRPRRAPGALVRFVFTAITCLVGIVISLLGQGNFLTNVSNFLVLVLYVLVPWTAINLTDFYFVRHGKYDVPAMFDLRGRYRGVDWKTMAIYLATILVEVPFMSNAYFSGPIGNALHGADISWLIGLAFAGGVYFFVMRRDPEHQDFTPVVPVEPSSA